MLRFQLLGGIELTGPDVAEAQAVLTRPKRLALLVYLALATPRGYHRRDTLLALFWPDLGLEEARRALRQSLHRLRQHLGADAILNRGLDEVGLNPAAVACDVWEFQSLLEAKRDLEALAHYRGELLPGFHITGASAELAEWLDQARMEVQRQALDAMRRVADRFAGEHRLVEAVHWARRVMTLPVSEERDLLRLMRLLREAGEDAAAIDAYRGYARRLEEQFETEPGAAAQALLAEIRRSAVRAEAPRAPRDTPPAPPDTTSSAAPGATRAPTPAPAPTPPATASLSRATQTAAIPRWILAGMGVLVVLAFVGLLRQVRQSPPASLPAPPVMPRVAVAVFSNRSGDSALEPLGTMMADWVLRGATRVPRLEVVDIGSLYARGRSSAGLPTDARTLGEESGATLAVSGTYYRVGTDSLRFVAQVLDVATGRVLRQIDPVSARATEPLSAAEEVGDRLTTALASIVNPQALQVMSADARVPRYAAFAVYVRGQEAYWSGRFDEALPLMRQAAALDSGFSGARVFLTVIAAGTGRCALVDSIATSLKPRIDALPEIERVTIDISRARCRSDWIEALRLQRRRMELLPGAPYVRWAAGVAARQANRPATALSILGSMDPSRGLGWLGTRGTFYWREVTAALHMRRDFTEESRVADSLVRSANAPLASAYFAARSLAASGRADAAIAALVGLAGQSPDPALVAGQSPGDLRPGALATPGWVMYEIAAELAAHGQEVPARALALKAVEWFASQGALATLPAEHRYLMVRALLIADRLVDARRVVDGLVADHGSSADVHGLRGVIAALQRDRQAVTVERAWLTTNVNPSPVGITGYYLAALSAAEGDEATAMDHLESLPGSAHPYDVLEFHVDPVLRALRATERFRRFVQPRE